MTQTSERRRGREPSRGRLREEQRRATRARLIDAAIAAFAAHGYAGTSIEDIVGVAGTSRTTFYLHFKAKSELLPELMQRSADTYTEIYAGLDEVFADPTLAGVRDWLGSAAATWKHNRELVAPVFEAAAVEPEVQVLLDERHALQVRTIARAMVDSGAGWSAEASYIYASVLLAPVSHYFELYLRGQRFPRAKVLDAIAASWLAILGLAPR